MLSDEAIGVILKSCETNGFILLVTADHGNAERMIDEKDNPVTKHTTYRGEPLVVWAGSHCNANYCNYLNYTCYGLIISCIFIW